MTVIGHDTSRQNKSDPRVGPQQLERIYREGRLNLPYAGYEERLFSEQFAREACAWPEGDRDDLVMGHWFLQFRLPVLLAAASAEDEYDYSDDTPTWVRQSLRGEQVPQWARALSNAV